VTVRALPEKETSRLEASVRRNYNFGPPLYLLATLAAPFSVWLCLGICSALRIFWAITTRE
jgi:hypothetical protein